MRQPWIIIGSAVWVIAMVACTAILDPDARLVREEGPHFDHAAHTTRSIECNMCHGEADVGFKAMPELEFCNECHTEIDAEKPEDRRATAFYDAEGKGRWLHASKLGSELIYSHDLHVEKVGDCLACHKDVVEAKAITYGVRFTMTECTSCHAAKAPEKNDCATCHKEIRADRPPISHAAGWKTRHGGTVPMASLDGMASECAVCHSRSDCDECHRAETPRDHTNHFRLSGHAAAASINRERCDVCHTTDSCFECHREAMPRNHRGVWGEPFDRHCNNCHLPVQGTAGQGCGVCHDATPSHDRAPARPGNPVHQQTTDPNTCRECHTPLQHPDNGQSCLLCHS